MLCIKPSIVIQSVHWGNMLDSVIVQHDNNICAWLLYISNAVLNINLVS